MHHSKFRPSTTPNLALNLQKVSSLRGFVMISTTWSCELQCINSIIPSLVKSLRKWNLTYVCLHLPCITWFLDNFIEELWLNTCFGPLTYFRISFWSLNFKLCQFGPISLPPFTLVVPSVSFFSKNVKFVQLGSPRGHNVTINWSFNLILFSNWSSNY